ncbi:Nucleoside-diphosphate-sugar epimerase [Geosmithia morbida]|uniref:Nucleoside-diphosphate-sugar epimerase n=1 Tax=Geosmithia morbida TaxID=1094350 RepID=A0A9P4YSN1_9HYPO|nr:Nucleoside-diphosphate-sugar epimerase [Geosmithia morbida]KAF4121330.1 Nucleoside-diphosphate-sugar epimerase [Geosmithia morbida]
MSRTVPKLIVCGGNGFLGSRICKNGVARGWDVVSISRSGEPKWDNVTSSPTAPSWSRRVTWERADLLRPSVYASLLRGADYVVHSMGILLEADYKGVVSGRESPVAGLSKAFASSRERRGGSDPLSKEAGEDFAPASANDQFSYEVMNRDSAIALARNAAAAAAGAAGATAGEGEDKGKVPAFCYVSAAGGAPVLPQRYITTKRQAENTITNAFPSMRSIFPRPPIMYDTSRPVTMASAAMCGGGAAFNQLTGGFFGGFLGAAGAKPLKVDTVADAIVEALSDDTVSGPIEIPQIEELANKAWRKSML